MFCLSVWSKHYNTHDPWTCLRLYGEEASQKSESELWRICFVLLLQVMNIIPFKIDPETKVWSKNSFKQQIVLLVVPVGAHCQQRIWKNFKLGEWIFSCQTVPLETRLTLLTWGFLWTQPCAIDFFYQRTRYFLWWINQDSSMPIQAMKVLQLWVTWNCLWSKWNLETKVPKIALLAIFKALKVKHQSYSWSQK